MKERKAPKQSDIYQTQQHITLSSESKTASTHNREGKLLSKLIYNIAI